MGIRSERGFTILEVMLFLAISGALLAALVVGVNVNINQERYKDSVNSFMSTLQNQYVLAANVTSTRSDKWTCGTSLQNDAASDTARGTTDCDIIGRLIQGKADNTITISNVVAYNINQNALDNATSDIDALANDMSLKSLGQTDSPSGDDLETTQIDWGSGLSTVNGGVKGNGEFTMAVLRSPLTGSIETYVVNENTDDWKNKIITADSLKRPLTACITPSPGTVIAIPNYAVVVVAGSPSASGVSRSSEVGGC